MVRFRLALCLLAPALAGCYSDRLPPPNFRHSCSVDGDCRSSERCISGLCQVPCTQTTAEEDCPFDDGWLACFNGVCVTACELPAETCSGEGASLTCERPERRSTCTSPHMCLDLGIEIGGGGGFIGGGSDADLGVCGEWCTENSCPEGEICLDRFCVAMCDPNGPDTCNSAFGLRCQGGLCLPPLDSGSSATGAPTTDAQTTDATATEVTSGTPDTDAVTGEGGTG